MNDLTQIEYEGQFARSIRDHFVLHKPKRIIETGTYHGNGSTRIIASLIKEIPIKEAKFYSIECNEVNVEIARENLSKSGLIDYVDILSGLSVPKEMIPSEHDIRNKIHAASLSKVKLDHEQDPSNGSKYYLKETERFVIDNMLSEVLSEFDDSIDFALLDSGGHIGKIEFEYLISYLKTPCFIALDDTRHIKHFESRKIIQNDKRFEIINDNEEKFGSLICKFTPL